jgi:hypothetical protein
MLSPGKWITAFSIPVEFPVFLFPNPDLWIWIVTVILIFGWEIQTVLHFTCKIMELLQILFLRQDLTFYPEFLILLQRLLFRLI